jgi:hypothetical protein
MRALRLALPAALIALAPALPSNAEAQTRVVIETGRNVPVYSRRPIRRVAPRPRVIVVNRVVLERQGRGRGQGWFRRHGYRPVTLYYVNGRYFDRRIDRRGVREVVVFERDGRYYRDWDRRDRDDRRYEDRDRDDYDRWRKEHAGERDDQDKYEDWDD